MLIRLIRHGESQANVGEVEVRDIGDHQVALTERGKTQAHRVGEQLGRDVLLDSLVYTSPYRRTRETLDSLCRGAGFEHGRQDPQLRVYEDPRLREVDPGYYDYEAQQTLRAVHGWFYYRFQGGESPADCFDRTSGFIDSMRRQAERKGVESAVVITHGLTLRCFVMRYLHLTVEEFEALASPDNCDVVTLGPPDEIENPTHRRGRWAVSGIGLR